MRAPRKKHSVMLPGMVLSSSPFRIMLSSYSDNMNEYDLYTLDFVIFECFDFREFVILGLFVKSRIRELSILMIVALL